MSQWSSLGPWTLAQIQAYRIEEPAVYRHLMKIYHTEPSVIAQCMPPDISKPARPYRGPVPLESEFDTRSYIERIYNTTFRKVP